MLHNVVDLTEVLVKMAEDKHTITKELVGCLSPYIRDKIRRFGRYDVNMDEHPPHLDPKTVPISTWIGDAPTGYTYYVQTPISITNGLDLIAILGAITKIMVIILTKKTLKLTT